MTPIASHPRSRSGHRGSLDVSRKFWRRLPRYPTTAIERLLLMAMLVILPLEDMIPTIAGFSITYLLFAVAGILVLIKSPKALARTWLQPVFLAAYILLVLVSLVEFSHPYADYSRILQFGQMIVGAMFIASLCRDRPALRACFYGFILAGVWMSVFLFSTSFSVLRVGQAVNYNEASRLRGQIFEENALEANPNRLSAVAARGVVVALALGLTVGSTRRRILLLGVTGFCLVATFLPMSRGGVVIAFVSGATVMLACGINARVIVIALVLGMSVLLWVPNAVLQRMTFSMQSSREHTESRARIYRAAVKYLPEYIVTGVGVGNYYGPWGISSTYGGRGGVLGPHNMFIAVTIYWGIPGLLAFLVLIYYAYRCLPKRYETESFSVCLLGIATSLFLLLLLSHRLAGKEFCIGLGLLAAARCWIWPTGIALSGADRSGSLRALKTRLK
jgi:hypothetical protein